MKGSSTIQKPDILVQFSNGFEPFEYRTAKTSGIQMFPVFECPVFGSLRINNPGIGLNNVSV